MNVTLDQARTLDAFAREGTLQAAARRLHKGHPAVLYALKQLELQTGLSLFDRSGYRTRLTPAGEAVWNHCRELLSAERALEATCAVLQSGWEPVLRVVFDAIVPLQPFFSVVEQLRAQRAPTRLLLSVDSLAGVEARFDSEGAQLMIGVLPTQPGPGRRVHRLPSLHARLVAARQHPLAKREHVTREHLAEHVLLTVRGSDPRLQLATAELDTQSTVHLSDFHAKKAAILAGIGFGWLPDWLSQPELGKGTLRALQFGAQAVHRFRPHLVVRGPLGRAGEALLKALTLET